MIMLRCKPHLEVRKLLLDLWSLLTEFLNVLLQLLLSPLFAFLVHSLVDGFVNGICFFVVFVVRVFATETAAIA
jgi:hypothetical protein